MWSLRGKKERLKAEQLEQRERLGWDYAKLWRSLSRMQCLADGWRCTAHEEAEAHLKMVCLWGRRCRLEPIKKLCATLKRHWDDILDYYPARSWKASTDACNWQKRPRGYRDWKNFRTGCPAPSPTESPADSTLERYCQAPFLSASEHHANGRSASENLQPAIHRGLNPIYIGGCNHFSKGEIQMVPNTPISTKNASKHFSQGYRAPGEVVNPATIGKMDERSRKHAGIVKAKPCPSSLERAVDNWRFSSGQTL